MNSLGEFEGLAGSAEGTGDRRLFLFFVVFTIAYLFLLSFCTS